MSLSKREAESPSAEAPWGEADDQRLREAWAEGHSIIGSIFISGIYPMAAIPRLFQRPPLPPHSLNHIVAFMSPKFLDASPPIHRIVKDELNRDLFKKSVPVLAAKVSPARTGAILKAEAMRRSIIDLPKVKSVVSKPDGSRLVLLRFSEEADLPPDTRQLLDAERAELVTHTLHFDYNYWTADDILNAILPEHLIEGKPSGYAAVGHVAHLNLNSEYLPYKHVIGQIMLDKNPSIKTVVNKLDSIHNQFRFFKMELIAGEPNYIVEHPESNCKFTFDFSQVYWNSRLHTEHARLIDLFKPEDVIADVFAGVGPFAVPAGKKGCGVLANDLNPASYKYLQINIDNNNVSSLVRPFCEDGKDFIRSVAARVLDVPLPPAVPPKSKTQQYREQRQEREANAQIKQCESSIQSSPPPIRTSLPQRNRITQFVMNLPDSAIQFLDAFRGIFSSDNAGGRDLSGVYDKTTLPMVHCYCFTRELEPDKAAVDIRKRVEERLGGQLGEEVSYHLVRSVAPNKEMYCISFRLPQEIAFGG